MIEELAAEYLRKNKDKVIGQVISEIEANPGLRARLRKALGLQ